MAEEVEFCSGNDTIILWNLEDYPAPDGTDLILIRSKFQSALCQMGFHGRVEVKLHCEKLKYDSDVAYRNGKLIYLRESSEAYNKKLAGVDMTYYILVLVENSSPGHFNVAVIAKPTTELFRVLRCLESRGHSAVLIEPPPYEECLFSVQSLVDNGRLLDGRKPIVKNNVTPEDMWVDDYACDPRSFINEVEDDSHPSTKMVDFSVRARQVKGDRTMIFWDAVDCPFPLCVSSSPDVIYEKIQLALLERNFSGKVYIWAYVDQDSEFLVREKTWASKIYFLPGDSTASLRRIRMLNDILLLSRDSPVCRSEQASLILISDHFKGNAPYINVFKNLRYRHYYLVVVVPRSGDPDNWPGFLFDGAAHLLD